MNKEELIRSISQDTNRMVAQDKIALILDTAVEIMKRTLESGEPVKWAGFGSLVVKDVPPRRFYSPKRKDYTTSQGVRKIIFVESGKRKQS